MSSRKYTPTKVFPWSFYTQLPIETQVIFFKIRDLADKFVYVDIKHCEIRYHERSNPKEQKQINRVEARRIFHDLYPERVLGLHSKDEALAICESLYNADVIKVDA